MNIEPYHVLLFIHLISLILGFGSVLVIDIFGLLWILKKVKLSFVNQVANVTQPLIWTGWTLLVVTGGILIYMKGSISGLTTIKIFAVLMIGINGIFLHTIKKGMEYITDETPMPAILKFKITLATFISQVGWWTAIIIGFINNKFKANAPVIEKPWSIIVPFLIIINVIFVLGTLIFRKK